MPTYTQFQQFLFEHQALLALFILWTLCWKGVALWKAARNEKKWWFVALLLLNTLGILEILYIFVFSKKKQETNDVASQD